MTTATRAALAANAEPARVGRDARAPFGTYAPDAATARALRFTRAMPRNWVGQRLAYLVRHLAVARLRGRPLDVETYGSRMRLQPRDDVSEKRVLFTPQFFDPVERDLLAAEIARALRAARPGERARFHFVDVGAGAGAYSLFVAALAGPGARVLAVEPQPEVFDRLTFNVAQNALGAVKCVDCAVADCNGPVTLFMHPRNRGQASLTLVGADVERAVRVPARTLKSLLEDEGFERVDAMKLNVEGADDIVLEPFLREAPPSLRPRLLITEHGRDRWRTDVVALLAAHGYAAIAETRLNRVFRLG